jgi:hypothetical protein
MKNRAWIIPAVIFLILLAAWPFRWEKTPSQSRTINGRFASKGYEEYQFMRDRWTGGWWLIALGFDSDRDVTFYSVTMPVVPSNSVVPDAYNVARHQRAIATGIWAALLAVSGGWALASYLRGRKK